MNKTELKNFAVSARRDLLEKVALRAKIFGIDENNSLHIDEQFGQLVINGNTYPLQMRSAFQSLVNQVKTKGYEQLIEEVAYTWFNRIIAIRYMEVHDYLPERVNVLSSSTGKVEPDILSQFETMDLNIDTAAIKDLVRQGEAEQAFRKLFIAQCNALNPILPFMFEKINDYTELLLPDFLLDRESVISKLVNNEELTASFSEVEVIGWLYQFYNSEPKDRVFANLKKNKKIEKYDIPAATQLFTPKWIVQYMVENSLGQLWLESNPDSPLKQSMRYYIEPAEQDEDVMRKLEEIRYKNVNLEDITIIDPCVGSGHILVYAFDLLHQMYEEVGYSSGDIPQLILEKNLYGLDIDERAVQLASFALMMKAREKSRRVFRRKIKLNIFTVKESNALEKEGIVDLIGKDEKERKEIKLILDTFVNAKNFGSILQLPELPYDMYLRRLDEMGEEQLTVETYKAYNDLFVFKELLEQAAVMSAKYDISLTNPPYMGAKGMNSPLLKFVKDSYPNSKTDLFGAFIERCNSFTKENGFVTHITMHSWMFLSSFEQLRLNLLRDNTFYSILHLGMEAFEGIIGKVVQTVAVVLRNYNLPSYNFKSVRLVDFYDSLRWEKEKQFFNPKNTFIYPGLKYLTDIPGAPIAYWATEKIRSQFIDLTSLGEIADVKKGMDTGENDLFVRYWHEVNHRDLSLDFNIENIKKYKWFPYAKGGKARKWYGNAENIVYWADNGEQIKNHQKSTIRNEDYNFKECITWTDFSSNYLSARYLPKGYLRDNRGPGIFVSNKYLYPLLGLLCSNATLAFQDVINPTICFQVGNVKSIPVSSALLMDEAINYLNPKVKDCISISKEDWDSFETSWDFRQHPLLQYRDKSYLSNAYNLLESHIEKLFFQLKILEEEINEYIMSLYSLEGEIPSEVPDERITISKISRTSSAKTLLSYFIGCIAGRYSLDVEGLTYAGGKWDDSKYKTFIPNKYGLIQLTDEHYFEDDIIARLREFLTVTFSEETVEENLQWLAESLELKRNETAEERLRRYFLDEFFKDHCQVYQKRPIYWLVDSGKQKGLRTLIYMHRYQLDTMATIRFEHLQEIQAKYNNEIAVVDLRIVNPNLSATEKRDLEKRKTAYQKRLEELLEFDKKLAEYANAQISIDLDNGVKINYAKFDKVLAKIK